VTLGTCVASWVEQKAQPNPQPKSRNYFAYSVQDPTLLIVKHILVITGGSQVETLPPCWDLGLRTPCEPTVRCPLHIFSMWPTFFVLLFQAMCIVDKCGMYGFHVHSPKYKVEPPIPIQDPI
jgi:hypothetical protein